MRTDVAKRKNASILRSFSSGEGSGLFFYSEAAIVSSSSYSRNELAAGSQFIVLLPGPVGR